ncbi:MAG: histidine kinase dimerization/phosphoacceptor domain -containing protein [Balneolales bacterium]
MTKRKGNQEKTNNLRNRAEEKADRLLRGPEPQNQQEHELRVHEIELEMQNEELRRIQVELEASRTWYFDLYDLAPVGYLTISEKSVVLGANLTAVTQLGATRTTLVNQRLTRYILPDDQDVYYLHRKRLFETGEPQMCRLRLVKENGSPFWAQLVFTTAHEADGIRTGRIVMTDINEQKLAEEKVQKLLKDKEILLQEVHHRVKNDMSVIISLLTLQSQRVKNPSASRALQDAGNRIKSMMVLYDKLYRSEGFKDLPVKDYLVSLVHAVINNFPNKEKVNIEKHIDDFILGAQTLGRLGIILNELLSNAMKSAFDGREDGFLSVTVSLKDNRVTLIVADNGIGLPESINPGTSDGFGLQLVDMLAQQIRGKIRIERNNGTRFIVEFEA